MIIKTERATYTYPSGLKPSIKEATIEIKSGEFVLITGPSGCGKTTLCRCFNGLIPHFYQGKLEGKIHVAGLDVREHKIFELARHVGLVFQNPENQLFALSVEKDVAFGLENLGVPREEIRRRVDSALKLTNIYNLKERPPHELSGGEQQRVAIAAVLAMRPEVIVLDEPTSFLDPLGAKEIFEVIYELNRKLGITILLVEHRLDLTAKYADHIIIMNDGRVVFDGKPREILCDRQARLLGVGVPKVILLHQMLLEEGKLELNSHPPLSSDEMATMLKEALKR
jgi:energy-coupling factor transporter ATP-binding protein EcfA2